MNCLCCNMSYQEIAESALLPILLGVGSGPVGKTGPGKSLEPRQIPLNRDWGGLSFSIF